jgi:capsid protein
MIDPKKDFDAIKNLVRSGAMTPQEFIASFGGDWRNSVDDYKSFFDLCKEKGVMLDIDVAQVDQHGRQPSKGGAGDDDAQGKVDDATDDAEDDGDDADEAV